MMLNVGIDHCIHQLCNCGIRRNGRDPTCKTELPQIIGCYAPKLKGNITPNKLMCPWLPREPLKSFARRKGLDGDDRAAARAHESL